jgi:hypothetical protein
MLLLGLLALCTPPPGLAQEGPVSPARYFAPDGYRPKEFSLVRKDGWFHIFYIRENLIPGAPTQKSFGHAISRDLYSWTEQDTILSIVPGTFEGNQVWAPSVHKIGAVYHMFYVGMRHDPANGYRGAQTITSATSSDLWEWTRRGSPLFHNGLFPWAHYDSTVNLGRDCRDPYLWWDEGAGEWLLFVATRPSFRPQSMVIGIAGSTDLENWSDRGYVPITLSTFSFSDVAESPHIMTANDSLLLLLWTTNSSQALSYGRSTEPQTGWADGRRLRNMIGTSLLGWWGSESLEDGDREYFGQILNDWVGFWDVRWAAPDSFVLWAPDPFQVTEVGFDPAHASPGDTVRLFVRTVHGEGRVVSLSFEQSQHDWTQPVDPAALGLPDSITIEGDSASFSWVPERPADGLGYLLRARVAGAGSVSGLAHIIVAEPPVDPFLIEPDPIVTRVLLPRDGRIRFVREAALRGFEVRVHDVRGRALWSGRAGPGERVLVWDGRDGSGRAVPAGIYFARVTDPGRSVPERLRVPVLGAR